MDMRKTDRKILHGILGPPGRSDGREEEFIVAAAPREDMPHTVVGARVQYLPGERIGVRDWYTPESLEDLAGNGRLSLLVWDLARNICCRVAGEVVQVRETAMTDGLHPPELQNPASPAEKEIIVTVQRLTAFPVRDGAAAGRAR
jgi:hypothetical protein